MRKVKSNYVSQWLGVFVVAVILAGIMSIAASFLDFLNESNFTANSSLPPAQLIHEMNSIADVAAEPQAGKLHNTLNETEIVYMPQKYLTDAQLLQDATDAPRPRVGATPRIAFLFIVRGDIPHEPLWRRFFRNHEEEYSLYVHATPGHVYPKGSLFEGREVPSTLCPRFSRAIIDALRRLLSYALLDPRYNNVWFINVCESSIPIRAFPFAYAYLMRSNVSFVESFFPVSRYHSWETLPEFRVSDLRKGELWMALRRDHAKIVVSDTDIYFKFLAQCVWWCTWDEQYVQTLLHLRDARGIAERTVMYVNWTTHHGGSPNPLSATTGLIKALQSRMRDTDGERHDTAFENTTYECVHNGVAPSPCFLFARKFAASETKSLLSLKPPDLGY